MLQYFSFDKYLLAVIIIFGAPFMDGQARSRRCYIMISTCARVCMCVRARGAMLPGPARTRIVNELVVVFGSPLVLEILHLRRGNKSIFGSWLHYIAVPCVREEPFSIICVFIHLTFMFFNFVFDSDKNL